MEDGLEAGGEDPLCELWSERPDEGALGNLLRGQVAVVSPGQGIGVVLEPGAVADGEDGEVGELFDGLERLDLGSFGVEGIVELFCRAVQCEGEELFVGCATAEGAGTVSGGESGGLIEEKEFGPVAGLHKFAVPALELELTDNPRFVTPSGGDELLLVVVEDAAVASEEATGGISFDGATQVTNGFFCLCHDLRV